VLLNVQCPALTGCLLALLISSSFSSFLRICFRSCHLKPPYLSLSLACCFCIHSGHFHRVSGTRRRSISTVRITYNVRIAIEFHTHEINPSLTALGQLSAVCWVWDMWSWLQPPLHSLAPCSTSNRFYQQSYQPFSRSRCVFIAEIRNSAKMSRTIGNILVTFFFLI